MTQQEFTQRTNVKVTYNEFDAINEVYMNSDLDKDEFCKAWVKMNASRVKKAIAEQEEAERKEAVDFRLHEIRASLMRWTFFDTKASKSLSARDCKFLKEQGFETDTTNEFGYLHDVTTSSLAYNIGMRLGLYNA